ncbi:MAG TPA: tripartite tricarboxylate transporter TctB family protein [Beijerinckiaceae bacterium]|nr:tripartite tricarboxylate transporter TctB family protein [Beijerinckiaceae bacterium]
MNAPSSERRIVLGSAELWAALLWLAVSVFVVWAGWDLGIGTAAAPGSGFLPFWTGLLMCGFSLAVLWSTLTTAGPSIASLWSGARWGNVIFMIVSLVVYVALFETLGFLLATIPLLIVLLRGVDPVPWRTAVPLAMLSTFAVWWVLKRLLLIQLPAGVFGIG